jgi:hypothetical protein
MKICFTPAASALRRAGSSSSPWEGRRRSAAGIVHGASGAALVGTASGGGRSRGRAAAEGAAPAPAAHLSQVGCEGDDLAVVRLLQPLEDDGGVEAARVGQHDLVDLRLGRACNDPSAAGACDGGVRRELAAPQGRALRGQAPESCEAGARAKGRRLGHFWAPTARWRRAAHLGSPIDMGAYLHLPTPRVSAPGRTGRAAGLVHHGCRGFRDAPDVDSYFLDATLPSRCRCLDIGRRVPHQTQPRRRSALERWNIAGWSRPAARLPSCPLDVRSASDRSSMIGRLCPPPGLLAA